MAQQINEPFNFPVKPGSKEWSNLRTEKDRFNALQIPDEILTKMSTSSLVVACMNFPAFGHFSAYKNIQTGFEILSTKFNGLTELLKRNDAERCIIDIYKTAGEKGFVGLNLNLDERYWTIKFSWTELLLSQNILIESLDTKSKENLLKLAVEKFGIKQSSGKYSKYDLLSTAFLMARVLHSCNYDEFESEYAQMNVLNNFVNTSEMLDVQILDKIFKLTQDYLSKQD
jgi:hypothetical protein